MKHIRKLLIAAAILGSLLTVLLIFAEIYVRGLGPRAQKRVIADLSERFDADVKLRALQLTLVPIPHVTGQGLEVWRKNRLAKQPFLKVGSFYASASYDDLFYQRDRVRELRLDSLRIDIPRPSEEARPPGQTKPKQSKRRGEQTLRIMIETLVADGAVLQIEPKSPDKDPLVFDIEKLTMRSVGRGQPLTFVTALRNAKPPGTINSTGSFGPWERDDLRATPVKGNYKFTNANLAVFSGISGTLSSNGSYNGQLEKIAVDGSTDAPDFALRRGGAPVHLTTTFHALVDGTNGNTQLDPVDARFLNSEFTCTGSVESKQPHAPKTVDLQATAGDARMADILLLISGDSKPPLDGAVRFQSHILIPPGKEDVLNKLVLDGRFALGSAVFSNPTVEQRLQTLSDRARGITKKEEQRQPQQLVASNLTSVFTVENGVAKMSQLVFQVPGAAIRLSGAYDLEDQRIDMNGVFRMQATLAETQAGIKHWLLKPFDPIFEKDGAGFEVPLEVTGTRQQPDIAVVALHHKFKLK